MRRGTRFLGIVCVALSLALLASCGAKSSASTAQKVHHGPNVGLLLDRARDLVAGGHGLEAAKVYEKILEVDPDHLTSLYELAMLDRKLGRPLRSLPLLRRVIADDALPMRANLLYASIVSGAGGLPADPNEAKKAFADAEAHARAAIAANPSDSGTHANLGRVLAVSGRLAGAEHELHRALDLNPDDEASVLWLAIVRARRKEAAAPTAGKVSPRLARLQRWIAADRRTVLLPCPPTAGGALLAVSGGAGKASELYVGDLDGPVRLFRSGPKGFGAPKSIPGTQGAERLARVSGGVVVVRRSGSPLLIDGKGEVSPYTKPVPRASRTDPLDVGLPFAAEVLFGASNAVLADANGDGHPDLILTGGGLASSTPKRPRYVSLR